MPMITISLCMIVKNEEEVLDRCLSSIADLMDEIIIVDTGSTDRTKEIARRYTSKIYDFTWTGNFADARNYSFSKASAQYIYLRFRSIRPNFSSSRSSLVALLSAQHNALLTSSIVKIMNTRFCSSSQPFFTDRLMRSSRMPYRVFASVDRLWNRGS